MRLAVPVLHVALHVLLVPLALAPPSMAQADRSSRYDTKRIIDNIMRNYTRQDSPNGDSTTNVYIGLYILELYSINEAKYEYSMTFYLRQQWTDPRLRFDRNQLGGKGVIKLEDNIWEKIWVPDVFFRNERKADFHSVTVPNRYMNLQSDGSIWYVSKLSATLSCVMDFRKYPMDTQLCPIIFESFGHTMDTVTLNWLQSPRRPDDFSYDLCVPQFGLTDIYLKSCDINYTTGSYPCLQMTFKLNREFGSYIIQIYIPTLLIVILSWLSFWLNPDAHSARVSLGLLAVLTISIQSTALTFSVPKVSYTKAIDVWMTTCLGFVFASLLELAAVNVCSRLGSGASSASPAAALTTGAMTEASAQPSVQQQLPTLTPRPPPLQLPLIAQQIDMIARLLFPLAFLLFNIVYWVHCLKVA